MKQALAVDSWVKGKVDKWAWLRGRQLGRFLLCFNVITFAFHVASFTFYCEMSSVLDKGSLDLKVLVQINIQV